MTSRPCEVCSALASSETDGLGAPTVAVSVEASSGGGLPTGSARRVLIEDRLLSLCDEHAAEVQLAQVTRLDELRELFREQLGQRSLVSQRTPLDRRVFPPRPEGRRLDSGRRASDG